MSWVDDCDHQSLTITLFHNYRHVQTNMILEQDFNIVICKRRDLVSNAAFVLIGKPICCSNWTIPSRLLSGFQDCTDVSADSRYHVQAVVESSDLEWSISRLALLTECCIPEFCPGRDRWTKLFVRVVLPLQCRLYGADRN